MLKTFRDRALGSNDDFDLKHRCYNGVCLAAGMGCLIASVLNAISKIHLVVNLATFVIGVIYSYLYYRSRKQKEYEPVFWLYILSGSVLLVLTWIYIGGIDGSGIIVSMVALVALTAVLKEHRLVVVLTVFLPLMTGLFVFELLRPDLVIPYSGTTQKFIDIYLSFFISTFVIVAIISLLLNSNDRERKRLDVANRLLEEKNQELNRINGELEEALERVDTLSGLLPICASCKKVRDDQGYWNQIETYIRKHSRASFTHGICPECARKLYPDLEITKGGKAD